MLHLTLLLALQSGYAASDLPVLERFEFETEVGHELGAAVARLGDWNGDGIDDYAAGSPGVDFELLFVDVPEHGRVEVRSGVDGSVIAASSAFLLASEPRLGTRIVGGFDSDMDGNPELAVTAGGAERVVILERSGSSLQALTTLIATTSSTVAERAFGAALANVGDVNGDGHPDLAVGAPDSDRISGGSVVAQAGAVRLVSGSDWSTVATWSFDDSFDHFGTSIARVRDMNGNGSDELAIGAIGTRSSSNPAVDSPGEVYFVDPQVFLTSPVVNVLTQGVPGDGFGASLLEVGDITGGTASELVVGAMRFESTFEVAAGQSITMQLVGSVTLYELDSFQPLWKVTELGDGPVESSSMGLGDVDGDGSSEVCVLAGWSDRQLPQITALRLIDGVDTWRFDAAGAGRNQGHAFVVGPDGDGDGRDEVVLGLPALEDRGALLTYRIDPNPPGPAEPATWFVDDDGSADFVGLSQAALVARSGDRVRVAPGEYANAWIARELVITGPNDLEFTAAFPWLEIKGAVRAHADALTVGLLGLGDLFGRATLDRLTAVRAVVVDCEDATIAHSSIGPGRPGIDLRDAFLQVRSSHVEGWTTTTSELDGFAAVELAFGAELLALESVFVGGDDLAATLPDTTLPGPGLRLGAGCRADLRGTAAASTTGGSDASDPSQQALGLELLADAVTFVSGAHSPVFKSGPGWLIVEDTIRPWLEYESSVAVGPGASWKVVAHAEPGASVAFFLCLQAANFELPGLVVGTPIWVNTASQIGSANLVGEGTAAPPSASFPVPNNPALIGLQLHLQGFALRSDGTYDGTNGGALLIRD